MYCIPCTPLIALSRGISVDFTNTSALEPGYAMKIFTRGGAISGNCDIGLVFTARKPRKIIARDMAIARTGL